MADYIGRTADCTNGTAYPSHPLSSYAAANGFSTALLGVVFPPSPGQRPKKIYTYWGHTGIKDGDYVEVLVPRGSKQEAVTVRVQAVLPADHFKDSGYGGYGQYTAKHIYKHLGKRQPGSTEIRFIVRVGVTMIQEWVNATSLRIAPLPLTEHARKCISEIDGALKEAPADSTSFKGDGTIDAILADSALDIKTDVREQLTQASARAIAADLSKLETQYYAHMRSITQQDIYKQYMCDWQVDGKPESYTQHKLPLGGSNLYKMDTSERMRWYASTADMATMPREFYRIHEPWRMYQWYMEQRTHHITRHGDGDSCVCIVSGDESSKAIPQKVHEWLSNEYGWRARKDLHPMRAGATVSGRWSGRTDWGNCPNKLVGNRVDFILCDDLGDEEVLQTLRSKQMTDVVQAMSAAPPAKLQPFNPDVYTKENILMSKIETVVYVTLPGSSGRYTAESVTKEQYFNAIAQLERQIETLEKVKHKPASLHQEIEDLNKQIDDLGKLCDLYYAKKEPILGQAEQSDAKDSAGDASSYIARPDRD